MTVQEQKVLYNKEDIAMTLLCTQPVMKQTLYCIHRYSVKLNQDPLEKFFGCIRQHGRVLLGLQRLLETAGDLTSERKLKLKM